MEPVVLVGADAASTKTRASLRFTPVESEYPLPEVRKRWCEAAWKMLQLAELDGVFNNELSSEEKYRVAPTPLDTVPVPTVNVTDGITARDVMAAQRFAGAADCEQRATLPRRSSSATCSRTERRK